MVGVIVNLAWNRAFQLLFGSVFSCALVEGGDLGNYGFGLGFLICLLFIFVCLSVCAIGRVGRECEEDAVF